MATDQNNRDAFGVRLNPHAARALKALQSLGLPKGATPKSKLNVIEHALLALAETMGIDVTAED